jgi:serine/threonine protein phosphatase PrpC
MPHGGAVGPAPRGGGDHMAVDPSHDSRRISQLFCDGRSDLVDSLAVCGGTAAVYSSRSPEKETPNEDAAGVVQNGNNVGCLIVADGLGGMRSGDTASQTAVQVLIDSVLDAEQTDASLRAAVLDGVESANQAIQQLGVGAATTLAVLTIEGSRVRPFHVGDSMILIVGQRGKIKFRSISHSPVGFAVEAGVIDESEAMHHEERHIVSNVVGCSEMRIDIGPDIDLSPRDTALLGSDGLFDNLHVDEIVECIRKGPLDLGVERAARLARQRMTVSKDGLPHKPDDLTILAFRRTAPSATGHTERAGRIAPAGPSPDST